MSIYAHPPDITARLGNRVVPPAGGASPNATDLQDFLDQAEAELGGVFGALNIAFYGPAGAPFYAPRSIGNLTILSWVADYVAGRMRGYQAAGGGNATNPDGQAQIKAWQDRIADIRRQPEFYAGLLAANPNAGTPNIATNVTEGIPTLAGNAVIQPSATGNDPVFRLNPRDPSSTR